MQNFNAELDSGPIPFERFMEIALYGPEGFFKTGRLRSDQAGDFLTSPEVSSYFGSTLAAFIDAERSRIGEPFSLIEVGAGSGSLLKAVLNEIEVDAWAVEVSPAARESLAAVLPTDHIVSLLDEVPARRGVVVANELLDNLPMALARRVGTEWSEEWVAQGIEGFKFVEASVRPEVLEWLEKFAGPVEEGGLVEVQLEAGQWLKSAMAHLDQGAVVIIDYGELAENLSHRRKEGTLRTYREHHLGPPLFHEPGSSDITADVNFSALLAVVAQAGWTGEIHRQDEFLKEWGLIESLAALRTAEAGLAGNDEMGRLAVRHEIVNAKTLLNERGLGDFRVMVARGPLARGDGKWE